MGFVPMILRDLVGCYNHWATEDFMVSRVTRLHSHVVTGTQQLTNGIALSH